MEKKSPLTRTCFSCGIEKPLAAFLQLSGTQGTLYGNICADCRNIDIRNKKQNLDTEERGRSSTGIRIDSKVKVQREIDQKIALQKQKDDHLEENKKLEKDSADKSEQIISKEKGEKDHRTRYIEAKQKRDFLGLKQKAVSSKSDFSTQEKNINLDLNQSENQRKEDNKREELNQTTDFSSGASIDPGLAGIRFQLGESQKRLETLLGKSAFMSRIKHTFGIKNPTSEKPSEPTKSADEPIVDYVKNNLSSTRKGR